MQHDASEFLQHLHRAFASATDCGFWQARLSTAETDVAQVTDQGSLWPLVLAVPLNAARGARQASLQHLLVQWRNQASRHAFASADSLPVLFAVQIHRFGPNGSKLLNPVQWGAAVYVPAFTDNGVHTTSQRYIVDSVIFHLGESVHQGHYRVVFSSEGSAKFITDDNKHTCPVASGEVETAQKNSYIFFLRRDDAARSDRPRR